MGDAVSTLLFQPPPPSKLKEHKIVWLNTRRGTRIPGFYISYKRQGGVETCRSLTCSSIRDSNPQEGITILYSHANAEDLGSIYPWCKFLSKMLQVNLFAYDYTGYGMSSEAGPPSEEHCYADIEAAYDYLRNYLKVPAKNIVLYGRSLGTGPSCYMAVKTAEQKRDIEAGYGSSSSSNNNNDGPVGGLILHAPFLSVFRVVIDTGCTLPGDKFPNVDLINMVQSPTILVHGTNDQIVPFHHSERLFDCIQDKYRARPIYIQGMSHNNVHSQVRPLFCDRLSEYLEECVWPQVVTAGRSSGQGGHHHIHSTTSSSSMRSSNKARSRVWKIVDHELEFFQDEKPKAAATTPARLASALGI